MNDYQIAFKYLEEYITLSNDAKNLILPVLDLIEVNKGEELITLGHYSRYMYFICKGAARGYHYSDGKEETSSLNIEGTFLGDVTTYISNAPALKNFVTTEPSTLIRIRSLEFRKLFAVNHEICNLGRVLVEQQLVKIEKQRTAFIGRSAQDRYLNFILLMPGYIERFKSIYIASYLGITAETFSRIHSAHIKKDLRTLKTRGY